MMIVMKADATDEQIDAVVARIEAAGCTPHIPRGAGPTVIAAVGGREAVGALDAGTCAGVEHVAPILKPYKLSSAQLRGGEGSVHDVGGVAVGEGFTLIAGPCTVEDGEGTLRIADSVAAAGAQMLRGGAYKPRTSPYSFQGLGLEGLAILQEARERTGLPVVTELTDAREAAAVAGVADVIQIGARNMQNYSLLSEVGRTDCAVLLKRGLAATLEELLMAAEYVLKEGNERVILCERGIRTHESAYRFTLDLLAVPALREMTHLPVIVDPSHAAGRREWVAPMALAAAAAGADGVIVEVHDRPEQALCDGPQALPTAELGQLAARLRAVATAAAPPAAVV